MFLPGESQGQGAWWAAIYGVAESDTTEATWQQQQQHDSPVGASLIAQLVKNLSVVQENLVQFLGWEDPLEKG